MEEPRTIATKPFREGILAGILFCLAAIVGMVYVGTYQAEPYFCQHMFGPAAMWACGRGFENPMLSRVPSLEAFLYWKAPCFACSDLPADLPLVPPNPALLSDDEWKAYHPHPEYAGWLNAQKFHRYLLMSAAILWRMLGVSWQTLLPLYGLLYGVTILAAYGIFRLGMRRPLAFTFALLLIFAPLHLQQLPDLRDYAKAPFFLTAIFGMGLIILHPLPRHILWCVSGALGLLLGLGIGFRQDILICIPAFLIVLFLFEAGSWREMIPRRCLTADLFLTGFLIAGGPILSVLFTLGNNSTHDTLIGFTRYCDQRLGVGSALYDFGDPFLDEYTRAVVEGYDQRLNNGTERLRHYTHAYDKASSAYFLTLAKTFPADLVTRAYAAVLRVLDELRPDATGVCPRGITNPILQTFYTVYGHLMRLLLAYSRYVAAATLILISTRSIRRALCTFFILCWFAGYPSLRFSVRHAFHLQFISYFAAGFLIQQTIETLRPLFTRGIYTILTDAKLHVSFSHGIRRAIIFTAVAAIGLIIPLNLLRTWQQHTTAALFHTYASAPCHPVAHETTATSNTTFFQFSAFGKLDQLTPDQAKLPIQSRVLVMLVRGSGREIPLTLICDAEDPMWDFSRIFPVACSSTLPGEITRVLLPIYFNKGCRFKGISVPTQDADRIIGFEEITDLKPFPILLFANLCPDWEHMPRYYVFTR